MNYSVSEKPKSKIRVLLMSPYTITQASLRFLLESNDDLLVTGNNGGSEKLPKYNDSSRPNIGLIYLKDEDTKTVESISELQKAIPEIRVIVVTREMDFDNQTRAIQLGAVGIVRKEQNARTLIEAIRQVHRGETWINQILLNKILNNVYIKKKDDSANGFDSLNIESLTPREQDVIQMIGKGLKNRDIAKELYISEATVRHHLSSVYGKLGVADRLNLVIYACEKGLVGLGSTRSLPLNEVTK